MFGLSLLSSLILLGIKLYKRIFGKRVDYIKDSAEIVRTAMQGNTTIEQAEEGSVTTDFEDVARKLKEMGDLLSGVMGNIKSIKPVLN